MSQGDRVLITRSRYPLELFLGCVGQIDSVTGFNSSLLTVENKAGFWWFGERDLVLLSRQVKTIIDDTDMTIE